MVVVVQWEILAASAGREFQMHGYNINKKEYLCEEVLAFGLRSILS